MPRGLPIELTSFVGRRQELAEARRLLRTGRAVTLVGAGGVGKTRLARRLARQVERTFPDGVVLVELGTLHDADSLTTTVAAALGVDPQGAPTEEAIASYLRNRRLLLVLDNCEHLVQQCAALVGPLLDDAAQLRVLATSRQPFRLSGEHAMMVAPLSVPSLEDAARGNVGHVEAVALLVDRVRAVDPGFRVDAGNAELVSHLCRALDGIPLAIELAAPRLRVLSLSQLVERLDRPLALLTAGLRGAPDRHQTLRAVIDWSHDLCSPAEQALWAHMSLFEGGADLAAIEAVCAEPGVVIGDVLAGLVDKSVVSTAQGEGRDRVRMLETIREYGAERLHERGEEERVRNRHRDHYLARAQEARAAWFGPDQLDWLAWANSDMGNLRACFAYFLADERGGSLDLELASAVAWYWQPAGAIDEGLRWFNRALDKERPASPAELRALADALQLSSELLDMEALARLGRRAVALPTSDATPADRAARQYARAIVAVTSDDYDAALTAYSGALADFRAAGDLKMQADTLFDIAVFLNVLGRNSEAVATLEEALGLCESCGERFRRRFVLESYQYVQAGPSGYEQHLAAMRAGLAAWPVVQPQHVAQPLWSVAKTLAATGEHMSAAILLGARVRIWHDFGVALAPYEDETFDEFGKRLTLSLEEIQFRTAYEQGYAMSTDEAVRFALGERQGAAAVASGAADRPLSKREHQVAALIGRGLTNKEIAQELSISPRTAEGHAAKVMDKLGVNSREQVASWMAAKAQE